MSWFQAFLHKHFGFQYIEYRDSCTSFVARAIKCPNGKLRLTTGYGIYDDFLMADGKFEGRSGRWSPLTFDMKDVT